MPTLPHTRVRVFVAGVVLYLISVSVAALTGIPSFLAVSSVLVAASTWAFGIRAGSVAIMLRLVVTFALFSSGLIAIKLPPVMIVVPAAATDAIVLLAIAALRRAEFRQAATEVQLRQKNAELEATLAEVKELRGLLPICAWCKCVPDVDGMWNKLEAYLGKHSHATFTHGICPACLAKMNAEVEGLAPSA